MNPAFDWERAAGTLRDAASSRAVSYSQYLDGVPLLDAIQQDVTRSKNEALAKLPLVPNWVSFGKGRQRVAGRDDGFGQIDRRHRVVPFDVS